MNTRAARLPGLAVSPDKRSLVAADGSRFFWLGDTAWELFHRLDREETLHYLDNRAAKGFTVIQACALAELDGLDSPNAYGHRPLENNDPRTPAADGYWDHVDFVVREANRRGLYIGFLPTWGDKWNRKWGIGPEIFDPENAAAYGRWLGERYRSADLVWILGGDRPIENETHLAIIRSMAAGLREGDGGSHLMTFHPNGGGCSSKWFHGENWLDFNMQQNGHDAVFNGRYEQFSRTYNLEPPKPLLDGEPLYEDHPISQNAAGLGHSLACDVRRALYWDLFGGAFGHTYGHHSVWQMWDEGRAAKNDPLMSWKDALDRPAASQMRFARALLDSRPSTQRVPDMSVIVPDAVPTAVPGAGCYRFAATRDADRAWAMIYAPAGRAFRADLGALGGSARVAAWWFNPRDGSASPAGNFGHRGATAFQTPAPGEALDWILVLDDAARGFGTPGKGSR